MRFRSFIVLICFGLKPLLQLTPSAAPSSFILLLLYCFCTSAALYPCLRCPYPFYGAGSQLADSLSPREDVGRSQVVERLYISMEKVRFSLKPK